MAVKAKLSNLEQKTNAFTSTCQALFAPSYFITNSTPSSAKRHYAGLYNNLARSSFSSTTLLPFRTSIRANQEARAHMHSFHAGTDVVCASLCLLVLLYRAHLGHSQ